MLGCGLDEVLGRTNQLLGLLVESLKAAQVQADVAVGRTRDGSRVLAPAPLGRWSRPAPSGSIPARLSDLSRHSRWDDRSSPTLPSRTSSTRRRYRSTAPTSVQSMAAW